MHILDCLKTQSSKHISGPVNLSKVYIGAAFNGVGFWPPIGLKKLHQETTPHKKQKFSPLKCLFGASMNISASLNT